MRKIFSLLLLVFVVVITMTGCTHKIEMAPNVEKITDSVSDVNIKEYNVAYHIRSYEQDAYVVTPGGGGDKVGYYPYNDTEHAFRGILSTVFKKVYKIDDMYNKDFIQNKNIRFIFTYNLKTNSSSDSVMTWPPTKFTISLDCKAIDKNGNTVWQETVSDEGKASFSEFKNDFSLAARRASENVFTKLLFNINSSDNFDL